MHHRTVRILQAAWTLGIGIVALVAASELRRTKARGRVHDGFIPYSTFYRDLLAAKYEDYAGMNEAKVLNADEFSKMKAYLSSHYEGVEVNNSFVLNGHVDCVDVDTQPSARKLGIKPSEMPVPVPPPSPRGSPPASSGVIGTVVTRSLPPPLSPERKDVYGNTVYCEKGSVPMLRVTLENLVQHETLSSYFYSRRKHGGPPHPRHSP